MPFSPPLAPLAASAPLATAAPLPDLPCDFYFLRHGQTSWNAQLRLQGFVDVPLDAVGIQQAQAVAPVVAQLPVTTVITSTLFRAMRTAALATGGLPHAPQVHWVQDANLRERSFGDWEGFTLDELQVPRVPATAQHPAHMDHLVVPPNGEAWPAFTSRVMHALQAQLRQHGPRTLVVGHGYIYIVLMQHLGGRDAMCPNCALTHFQNTATGWQVRQLSP